MRWFRLFVVTVSFALGLSACNCARPPVQETLKNEGEACEADDECASRLCDKLPGKSKVCFRRCSTNCNPGDICTALAPNDRFACVPEKPGLCQPCALNVDCPYPGDRCIELGGTKVCARDCSFDGQCPSSYRCADGTDTNGEFVTKQCQPTSGTCECTAATAGQTRPCSETNSIGTCTGVQTCRPPNGYDACSALVPSAESCNGRDDDCNGMTDENLGETTCGTGECRRTVSNCVNGSPQICEPAPAGTEVCDDKDNDCDGVVDDGFDKMTSLTHCGACNTPCARANATPVCTGGMCGIQACNPGFVNADGIDSNGCEYMCTPTAMGVEICDGLDNDCDAMIDEGFSLASDPTNCGLCGRVCNVNNGNVATYACVAASCGIGTCNLGFADCDQTYSNGCEKNVSNDVANCGACNSPCMVAHGTPGCANSTCTVASCDMGWGNCNNMASDGCEQDTTGSIAHCGACNSPCPTRANAASICTASSCGYTCNTGYVDLDGLAANGCEYQCTAIGSDMPDYPMFVDANCDGVDGDASQAIFVSLGGSDMNPGTRQLPKRTITAGINAAATFTPRRSVFVAAGVYAESVTLQSGVSVYGGYDPASWQRSTSNVSHIQSPSRIGVTADTIALSAELQLMKITSANATGQEANGDGRSSIGLLIVDSPAGVTVTACDITAGNGSAGAAGAAGTTGTPGGAGSAGGAGSTAAAGAGGSSSCGAPGGSGGGGVSGTTTGNGGTVGTQAPGGGGAGPAGSGGAAGTCGTTSSSNGSDAPVVSAGGLTGNPGANAAAPGQLGLISAGGIYLPSTGLTGGTGAPGGGAGGGGSGGGAANGTNLFCTNCSNITSGGGGGGGGGGCGGSTGTPGRGGGGSFAVLVANSAATVTSSTLRAGTGGAGGAGGNGGVGGSGGSGGPGATGDSRNNSCSNRRAGNGATGGRGGDGGRGGGATGGAGGPSIGLAWAAGTTVTDMGNTFVIGTGGTGGTGGTNGLQSAPQAPNGLVTQARSIP